nr:MAG TPA: hypothetical protein [Caudoviricetes sp.]
MIYFLQPRPEDGNGGRHAAGAPNLKKTRL